MKSTTTLIVMFAAISLAGCDMGVEEPKPPTTNPSQDSTVSSASSATAAPSETTEASPKAPAAAEDLNGPKDAAARFINAVSKGDSQTAKRFIAYPDRDGPSVDALCEATVAWTKLREASAAKFGVSAGSQFNLEDPTGGLKLIMGGTVAVRGDIATITTPSPDERTLTLRRIGGLWKVELVPFSADELASMRNATKSTNRVIEEIRAGKYTTVDAAAASPLVPKRRKMPEIIRAGKVTPAQ